MQSFFYWGIVGFLRLVTRIFFRTIEVVGTDHIPAKGPVVFVGNHPNSLVDPVMILTTAGRKVSLAARDGLFSMPHLMPLLWAAGAVPIKRRQDHDPSAGADHAGEKAQVDNSEAFAALHRVLAKGGAFGIFPEGVTYTESELQPLKTGAARIALSAVAEGIPVTLVPVGLTYRRRDRFRGRVLVQYGRPIALTEWAQTQAAKAPDDSKGASKALTADIELALRALTLNTPDFDMLRVLDGVRRLYVPEQRQLSLGEEAEVTRRIVSHYEEKRGVPEIEALYTDVASYLALLDALGLSDWDLRKSITRLGWSFRVLRHVGLLLFTLPLALPGLVLHFPILYGATFAGEMLISRDDVRATLRMMLATLVVLGSYLVVLGWLVWLDPTLPGTLTALGVVVTLALSGLAAIRVLERQYVIRHGIAVLLRILSLKDQVVALRRERDALQRRLVALAIVHVRPDLDRIVSDAELVASQPD